MLGLSFVWQNLYGIAFDEFGRYCQSVSILTLVCSIRDGYQCLQQRNAMNINDNSLLQKLRESRRLRRERFLNQKKASSAASPTAPTLTFGQRMADGVTSTIGSWRFIIIQSVLLACWMAGNAWFGHNAWDPYPFILLNLLLSFQAAYTAPAIMMSQTRQSDMDRKRAENDFEINVKAELEIELLHEKIDLLKEEEIQALTEAIRTLTARLDAAAAQSNSTSPADKT